MRKFGKTQNRRLVLFIRIVLKVMVTRVFSMGKWSFVCLNTEYQALEAELLTISK